MLSIGTRVLIYRGKYAGIIGNIVALNHATDGTPMCLVAKQPSRHSEHYHVRATDVRLASCLNVGREHLGEQP